MTAKAYAWAVATTAAVFILIALSWDGHNEPPSPAAFLFWTALLAAVELLPVTLGFGTEVTMGFPIHLTLAIIYPPWAAMAISGIGALDAREFKREIPLHQSLFNRCQMMLSTGIAAFVFSLYGKLPFELPLGGLVIAVAALLNLATNLSFVSLWIHYKENLPLKDALIQLLPDPIAGFWVSYVLLGGLGVATAFAYVEIDSGGWLVVAILIPLTFARLSILGARAQQELSEKIQRQQQALLEATEKVFQERELERHRIAEQIHDSSLQLLAAASYGCGNAAELLRADQAERARDVMSSARDAVDDAIKELRGSLVDLRRSSVESGGLMETIRHFADQLSTLWGTEINIDGAVTHEPPIPVALAAFQILQEGLVNALKHSQGGSVTVMIDETADGMVHIVVQDEGPGFDTSKEIGADHVGMRLMHERAQRVGGHIDINSRPGAGTRLEAVLPAGVAQ